MYRISEENKALLENLRESREAYQSLKMSSANLRGESMSAVFSKLPISPIEAMDMPGESTQSALPITVTITLTTVLWPDKAH